MIRPIWILSAHPHFYLRRYMPIISPLDVIWRRHNLKWGILAMCLTLA